MKKRNTLAAAMVLFVLGIFSFGKAQNYQETKRFLLPSFVYQSIDPDSLKGFDDDAARASAISEGFLGQEFQVRMYRLKREYINNKYNLVKPSAVNYNSVNYNPAAKGAVLAACVNEDFEATTTTTSLTTNNAIMGWTVDMGSNLGSTSGTSWNSCNLLGCCASAPTAAVVFNAPSGYIDPVIGNCYPIYSVFGSTPAPSAASAANPQIPGGMFGNSFIRINDDHNDFSIHKLSKTFAVTPATALFQFAFISVFYPGHGCCDAGAFSIKLYSNGNQIPCPTFSASALSSACTNTNTNVSFLVSQTCNTASASGSNPIFNKWQIASMDLTPYIGQNITINIVASDCTGGGHYGYVYFDAQCGPLTIYGNGLPYAAGSGTVTVPTCGVAGATICAPAGMGLYSWAGPNVPLNYATPSFTNQCYTTSISALYTVSMAAPGASCGISRVVQSSITPAPALNITSVQAQCGGTSATINVVPAGSLPSSPSLTWFPIPTTSNSQSTTVTYTLPPGPGPAVATVSTQDNVGCKVTVTANVYPAPPTPTFTFTNFGSQSVTCASPVVNVNAVSSYSYQNGSLSYTWQSANSTFQGPIAAITSTMAGTYTVTAVDPITNCGITHTISVNVNTVTPVAAVTPSNILITCASGSTASQPVVIAVSNPTVNSAIYITNPFNGTLSASGTNYTYMPGTTGTFSVQVVNTDNGCLTQRIFSVTSNQTFPTFNIVSPQNFTLGCSTKSVATLNFANQNSGSGAPVSFTMLSGNTPIPTTYTLNNGNSSFTVNSAGVYTMVASDNGSGCKSILPITVLDNKFGPHVDTVIVPRILLDCTTPSITLEGVSSTPSVSYMWTYNGTVNLATSTVVVVTKTATPNNASLGTYTLVMTDNNNLCTSTRTVNMYQCLYAPTASISPQTNKAEISCIDQSIVLNNTSKSTIPTGSIFPNGVAIGNKWQGPSPQVDLLLSSSYTAAVPGIYTLEVKDLGNGCISTATFNVKDNKIYPSVRIPNPTPNQADSVRYLDCGATVLSLSATANISSPRFSWARPEGAPAASTNTAPTFSAQAIGMYIVTVTDPDNGCATPAAVNVKNGKLTVDIQADKDGGFAPLEVKFTNNSRSSIDNVGIVSIWNFGNGNDLRTNSVSIPAITTFSAAGNYSVKVFINKGTCLDSVIKVIKVEVPSVFSIPNVFTPNGDGINDFFFLKTASLETIDAYIYDRWGRMVFKTEGSTTGNISWDGKNPSGKDCPDGTYFYIIKAKGKDGKDYDQKGNLSLFR
jgi:gliding motility-associated-like protein